jgi:hypothetical protein
MWQMAKTVPIMPDLAGMGFVRLVKTVRVAPAEIEGACREW